MTGGEAEGANGTGDAGAPEISLSGWWAPRVKANLADLLPGNKSFLLFVN